MPTLFEDDFTDLPIGVIAGDYSPAGEYHVVPAMSESGRWRETVVHNSYRNISRGNWQIVEENDGRRVLEQTIATEKFEPMLATGGPHWRDVTLVTSLRPMTENGWRAIIFRYRHSRRFYAAVFSDGELSVVRRDNDVDTVLGTESCTIHPDTWSDVRVDCTGSKVEVAVDGETILVCADGAAEAFETGCFALAANNVTRFGPIQITSSVVAQLSPARTAAVKYPEPKLWKKIRTGDFGSDRNLRIGDINGDGEPELVIARRTYRLGGDNYCSISCLSAWNLEGEKLWSSGTPDNIETHTTADLCFQVHDLDGDGNAEVIYSRDWELCIADGRTGEVAHRMPLPRSPEQSPGDLYRILGDSIFFCDLQGTGRPDSLILKDRYKHAWAYDRDFNELWQFSGNLGHFPYAKDVNGDGKDEIAIGYHLLDHDGKCRWTGDYIQHADNVALVELSDSQGRPEQCLVIAGSDAGLYVVDLQGNQRFHYPIGHAQSMCIGNLLPEREGLEIMCNTYWGPCGITVVLDESGNVLHEFEPMPYACLLQPVNWVPVSGGQASDLVLLSTHPRQGGLIDGAGERRVTFPDDGHPVLCSDARDLDGDGVDEVLTWDENEIWIYKAEVEGRTPENYPERNPWYNDSNYRAQISLPKQTSR